MGAMSKREIRKHALALAKMRGWEPEQEWDDRLSNLIEVDKVFEINRRGRSAYDFSGRPGARAIAVRNNRKI